MATKKYLDSVGVSYLWLRIMEQFSSIGHNHDNLYLSLNGGTVNGTITATKFITTGATANDIVLGDGSVLAISSLAVDSATRLATARNLWGNSFDGTADVSGDIKFGALTASRGMRIDDSNGFIGFSKGAFEGISLGWGANPEAEASSLRISDTAFKYKGYDVYHTGNFTYNGTDSNIYAPVTAGTTGHILTSAGAGAPVWTDPFNISVGTVTTTIGANAVGTTQDITDNSKKIATTEFVHNVLTNKLGELSGALLYKGTIGTGGTITELPGSYEAGWTYKVITAGTYAGQKCEVGDMIIAVTDGWTVVQNNIDIATADTLGLVKGGATTVDTKTYGVDIDAAGAMTVSVPWDDTVALTNEEIAAAITAAGA